MAEGQLMHFPGPCPLRDCLYIGQHTHSVCSKCSSPWWSNAARCAVCVMHASTRAALVETSMLDWRVNVGCRN